MNKNSLETVSKILPIKIARGECLIEIKDGFLIDTSECFSRLEQIYFKNNEVYRIYSSIE